MHVIQCDILADLGDHAHGAAAINGHPIKQHILAVFQKKGVVVAVALKLDGKSTAGAIRMADRTFQMVEAEHATAQILCPGKHGNGLHGMAERIILYGFRTLSGDQIAHVPAAGPGFVLQLHIGIVIEKISVAGDFGFFQPEDQLSVPNITGEAAGIHVQIQIVVVAGNHFGLENPREGKIYGEIAQDQIAAALDNEGRYPAVENEIGAVALERYIVGIKESEDNVLLAGPVV